MNIIYIILILIGFSIDIADFILRVVACLQRKQVPSAGMFLGFFLMAIGINGLTVLSSPINMLFSWIRWKKFFILLGLALILHLFIHLIMPLIFTITCNIRYKRNLLDFSPLPPKSGGK